jgi:HlyD family secretion protein
MSATTTNETTAAWLNDSPWTEGRMSIGVIILFFGGFLGWASLVPLDAGVVGGGVVRVVGNRETVQHREGGIISRLAVKEGDHVKEGQVLLELAATELVAQEASMFQQAVELEGAKARLEAERDGRAITAPSQWASLTGERKAFAEEVLRRQKQEMGVRSSTLASQVRILQQRQNEGHRRIASYGEEMTALERQDELVGQELESLRDLASEGFAAQARVRNTERAEAEIQQRRAQIEGQQVVTRQTTGEASLQIVSIRQQRRESIAQDLSLTDAKLSEINPKLAGVRAQLDQARVRAPATGSVVGLTVFNEGAVVRPGERILDVVPDQREMVVEAQISSQDVNDVASGMKADVRFPGLGARGSTRVNGEVRRLSADRFKDERTGRDYFVVEVGVPATEMKKLAHEREAKQVMLRSGMPAEVIIPLRPRTAMQYLWEPLDKAIWHSFREH